jgi:hypothetical protein
MIFFTIGIAFTFFARGDDGCFYVVDASLVFGIFSMIAAGSIP